MLPSLARPERIRCSENHSSPAWYTKHWYASSVAKSVPFVGIRMAQTLPSVPTTAMKLISTCRARPSCPNVRYSTTKIIRLHR